MFPATPGLHGVGFTGRWKLLPALMGRSCWWCLLSQRPPGGAATAPILVSARLKLKTFSINSSPANELKFLWFPPLCFVDCKCLIFIRSKRRKREWTNYGTAMGLAVWSNLGNFQGHSVQNCIKQALENFPSSVSIEMTIGNLSCFIEICLYNFAYTIACFKGTKGPLVVLVLFNVLRSQNCEKQTVVAVNQCCSCSRTHTHTPYFPGIHTSLEQLLRITPPCPILHMV